MLVVLGTPAMPSQHNSDLQVVIEPPHSLLLPSMLKYHLPLSRHITHRINYKHRILRPVPRAPLYSRNPHRNISAIRIPNIHLLHLLPERSSRRIRVYIGTQMPLHTHRRVAIDRNLARHCCVAGFGVVRGQASEPEAFDVEGRGLCVVDGEVDLA